MTYLNVSKYPRRNRVRDSRINVLKFHVSNRSLSLYNLKSARSSTIVRFTSDSHSPEVRAEVMRDSQMTVTEVVGNVKMRLVTSKRCW